MPNNILHIFVVKLNFCKKNTNKLEERKLKRALIEKETSSSITYLYRVKLQGGGVIPQNMGLRMRP
jgi:hypothetical protein